VKTWKGLPVLALVLPGGVLVAISARMYQLFSESATNDPQLDNLRWPLIFALATEYPQKMLTGEGLKQIQTMLVIANTERSLKGQIGDLTATVGPSIGPWQLSRQGAIDVGVWKPDPTDTTDGQRAAYAAEEYDAGAVLNVKKLARWSLVFFQTKLEAANGDFEEAIRRWNGSGPKAVEYQQRALAAADGFGFDLGAAA
jgi:hypothetical protein